MAPRPNPISIHINKYDISSGSLIAVLNLIIDSAPQAKERARDDC